MNMLIRIGTVLAIASAAWADGIPVTKKLPVTDVYHGEKVTEDYRWPENWEVPEVRRWSEAQNAPARSILDQQTVDIYALSLRSAWREVPHRRPGCRATNAPPAGRRPG